MDPITITTIAAVLKGIYAFSQWAFSTMEKVKQGEAAEIDALNSLSATMGVVESDISVFKKLIYAMQSPENQRLYDMFIQKWAQFFIFASRDN